MEMNDAISEVSLGNGSTVKSGRMHTSEYCIFKDVDQDVDGKNVISVMGYSKTAGNIWNGFVEVSLFKATSKDGSDVETDVCKIRKEFDYGVSVVRCCSTAARSSSSSSSASSSNTNYLVVGLENGDILCYYIKVVVSESETNLFLEELNEKLDFHDYSISTISPIYSSSCPNKKYDELKFLSGDIKGNIYFWSIKLGQSAAVVEGEENGDQIQVLKPFHRIINAHASIVIESDFGVTEQGAIWYVTSGNDGFIRFWMNSDDEEEVENQNEKAVGKKREREVGTEEKLIPICVKIVNADKAEISDLKVLDLTVKYEFALNFQDKQIVFS